jgi:hypothetical protein
MEKVTTVGVDLAKNVFALHAVGRTGKVVLKKTVVTLHRERVQPPRSRDQWRLHWH